MSIRSPLHPRLLLIPVSCYFITSLSCTQLPLLNYLGYEFSVVIALLGSFVSGILTIGFVKKSLRDPNLVSEPRRSERLFNVFKRTVLLNLTFLVIPLVVMLTNALFVKNCSLLEGAGFFILIPVVSVLFSCSLGFFCGVHYRWAKTMFVVLLLATFAEVLAVGYFTPAIFSYNFFYGYFPGLTYDEALGISWSLVLFRILTLILGGALVWMALLIVQHTNVSDASWEKGVTLLGTMVQGRSVYITGALATLVIVTWWFRGELGFDSTSRFIQKSLGETAETEHFRIYYSKQSYDKTEISWIAAEHEFRLKQITDAFSLPFKGKIESYIYPSNDVKQRLMGAGNTNIAKPWSGQIHISKQSLDATLKHELVHIVAAPFGLPIINASLSTGLVEGLAMAIEWDWGSRTPHQYAAAMRKFGVGPDISSLMSFTGFASQSSSISYVLAGSFCRYLIDTYGIRSMMLLYRSNKYEHIYNKPLKELIAEWRHFLDAVPVSDQDRDAVDVLFRRPPIFEKVCARVIAARNIEAGKKFGQRDYKSAAQLYKQSFDDGRGYDALSGYIASAVHAKDFTGVIAVYDTVIRRSENPSHYLPLLIHVGLAQWGNGNIVGAKELFRRVEAANLGETLTEASLVYAAATRDTANREALFRYFITASNDVQRLATLDSMVRHPSTHWLPVYLKGKVLARLRRWEHVLSEMKQLDPHVPAGTLEAIRMKTIGNALFRLRRFEDGKVAFWNSLNSVSTEIANNEVNDWVERGGWMEGYFTTHQ